MLRGRCGGIGIILTRARRDAFQPDRLLEITPEFLEAVITEFRRQGLEFISLDEMHRRLCEGRFLGRFVCITFDDGYRDNLCHLRVLESGAATLIWNGTRRLKESPVG